MAQIHWVVGAETKLAARLQLVGEHPDRPVVHHATLGMLVLGPWVGMEQVQHGQRAVRYAGERLQRVAMHQPDIGKLGLIDLRKGGRDTVQIRLGPDKAVIGQQVGTVGKVFTPAEPYFEMQGAILTEKPRRGDRSFVGDFDLGKQTLDQVLLVGAQRLAHTAPIQAVERRRIAFLECRHGAHAYPSGSRLSSRPGRELFENGTDFFITYSKTGGFSEPSCPGRLWLMDGKVSAEGPIGRFRTKWENKKCSERNQRCVLCLPQVPSC